MNDVAQSYAILEIPTTASPELTKQAYRKLAKTWHPDRYINNPVLKAKAEEKIKEINQAYAVIKNYQAKNRNTTVKPDRTNKSSHNASSAKVVKTQHTPEFYYQQGTSYLESEDYSAALNSFSYAIKLNPNYLEAYQYRGFILSKLGYELRANAEFKKANQIKLKNKVAASYNQSYTPQSYANYRKSTTSLKFWQSITGFKQPVKHLAISYFGQIATARDENEIELWQMDTGKRIGILQGHTKRVTCLGISSSGKTLISGSEDKTIRFWDLEERKIIRTFGGYFDGHLNKVTAVALTKDNQTLISCGSDHSLKIWNISRAMEIHNISSLPGITCLAVSLDDQLFCSGSLESQLQIRNINTGQVIRSIDNDSEVLSLAFSPDGNLLASGGFNCNIKLWDITTGKEIYTLVGHLDRVSKVIFSDDGKILISSSWDGTIKFWKLSTGKEVNSIEAHPSKICDMAIAPNHQVLASSSGDKTVKLWRCNL
ncbi:MAG: DnaJ domain-containing protein [Pleurocapsa sp.]